MPQFAKNKKAYHDYELLEEFEAGIALLGPEVKSVRRGRVQLKGSYVAVLTDGPYVMGLHISPYQYADTATDPTRKRKLLLHAKEIDKLQKAESTSGLTIIPLALYSKGGLVKMSLAIARGKKLYDKREQAKRKQMNLDAKRAMKKYN